MRSRVLAFAVFAALAASTATGELLERILAVVDASPVFLSDVKAVEHLDQVPRADALERTIDEILLFREAFRLPQASAGDDDMKGTLETAEPALRRAAHRRAVVKKYIAFRFRPQVRIDDEEIRRAYDAEWEGRSGAPPLESVAAALRERLSEDEVAARVASWLKDLRAAARIRYNAAE